MKICQFSSLLPLLPRATPPAEAVRVLQQTARLVRGLWVVRSDVLYPKGSQAPRTGVPGELLARGRDWMVSAECVCVCVCDCVCVYVGYVD